MDIDTITIIFPEIKIKIPIKDLTFDILENMFFEISQNTIRRVVEKAITDIDNYFRIKEKEVDCTWIFNYREGFSSKDDTLPEVFYYPFKRGPLDGKLAIDKADFQNALRTHYQLMGWDVDTGVPSVEELTELGLDWLVREVK